jgi:hypothetical protein
MRSGAFARRRRFRFAGSVEERLPARAGAVGAGGSIAAATIPDGVDWAKRGLWRRIGAEVADIASHPGNALAFECPIASSLDTAWCFERARAADPEEET